MELASLSAFSIIFLALISADDIFALAIYLARK
jgi:hypothetical protein